MCVCPSGEKRKKNKNYQCRARIEAVHTSCLYLKPFTKDSCLREGLAEIQEHCLHPTSRTRRKSLQELLEPLGIGSGYQSEEYLYLLENNMIFAYI